MKKIWGYLMVPLVIPVFAFGFIPYQASPVSQPQSSEMRVSVSDTEPRPLAKVAAWLEQKFGIPISYEDAPWSLGGEKALTDVELPPIGGGRLDVTLPIDGRSGAIAISLDSTLKNILEQHVANRNPGTFRLVSLGEAGFSIVSKEVRDSTGRNVSVSSPLDATISFADQKRRVSEILAIICEEITKASGKTTKLGTIPNSFLNSSVEIGAHGEAARDVLLKTFRTSQRTDTRNPMSTFSWRLLYSPTGQEYFLNIHPVQQVTK